jgi:hypothetical protein
MKTKKGILESCIETKKNSGAEYSKDSVQDAVMEAMDEFAAQQAIAFLEYKQEQGYILEHARNEYMKFGAAYMHEPRLSPEQLYAQFIESQSTNNKEVV